MAATQPSLHSFYKSRKSARESTLKSVKNNVVRDADVVEDVIPEGSFEKTVANETVEKNVATPASLTNISSRRSTRAASKPSTKKAQVKKSVQGTQDILTAFKKASEKAEAKASKETIIDPAQDSKDKPPVTPKRKKEDDELEKRKRRKQNEEDDRTPQGTPHQENVPLQQAPKSAKKKLVMDSKITQEKKMTPAEIKERLGKCGRLDQLRAKLLKVNQCGEKLRQFRENTISETLKCIEPPSPAKGSTHPQLEKFASLDVEVPVSPRKTPIKTPSKTPVKAPAYERFQHLAGKPSEELVLPYKYRFLKDMFRAVDTVVSLLHNRHEVITYSKLKPAVQEMMRKAFEERHLGQLKTVFPLAYIFKQERKHKSQNAGDFSKAPYELTVASNMDYKGTSASQNLMSKFNSAPAETFPKFRKMDSVVLVERRNVFHNSLISIVKDHHTQFLQELDPPIQTNGRDIKRWHPEFPLEDLPDIEAASLPKPPLVEKLGTARDILDKAQDLFAVNHRLEKAISEAAEKTPVAVPQCLPSQSTVPTTTNLALKGVSSSLLEKIRAREAAKAQREMTRSSGENKQLEMLSRLPEMSRIIRNTFVTEKKAALPWELVAAKVASSYTSMLGGNEVDSHLELLIKEVPGWCTVHNVRSGKFLKINKNEQLSTVEEKLQAAIKQKK